MNKIIEIFGNHIYKQTPVHPEKTLRHLSFVYTAASLQCKYFPTKLLLPARQYMQWAAADAVLKPLRNPQNSAIVSLYLPCEILHAMNIYQMFPEALACYLAAAGSDKIFIETAENNGLSKTLCSYHKSFIGMVESGVLPKPEFVINTSLACDANHLSFRRAANHYGVNQFMIDVPSVDTPENTVYIERQLHELVHFIEENSSEKLNETQLIDAVERSKRTIRNFREMIALRAQRTLSDEMTSHMLSVFATHVMLGTKEAEKYSADLLCQIQKLPEKKGGVRLLWVHTLPYWQDALRNLINFTGRCEIVACDMTLDALDVDLDEPDPYRFMATRLLRNTVNGSGMRRVEAACRYARQLNADGIVWYCHWGCKQTAGMSTAASEYFERQGMPVLILDGDGCDTNNVNDGQTVTRMEAFLELLEEKRK